VADRQLEIDNLAREIDWSKEYFLAHRTHIFEKYFTLGREVQQYLLARQFDMLAPDQQWSEMQAVLALLHQPTYYLIDHNGKLVLSLLPFGEVRKQYTTAIEALNDFFLAYTQQDAFMREKARALQMAEEQIKQALGYVATSTARLSELESDTHWQQWADLLMANLHQVAAGTDRIRLSNFFDNGNAIEIPVKKEWSAQKNAEVYYRKSKNRVIEIQHLREAIAARLQTLEKAQALRLQLANANDLKTVRALGATLVRAQKERGPSSKPFHEFMFLGFQIRVGKDAVSNDELTLHHSHKEDLWLHAKDVAGSHVVIKHQAGKKFPKEVIERAAQLAAYNSKRKTETLCPVTVTPRKFVRKRKGDPPGAVVVEREEVILVEPRL
jgi:predicted ribosome quality control (RQC) complex YloA/Tae2 family protein